MRTHVCVCVCLSVDQVQGEMSKTNTNSLSRLFSYAVLCNAPYKERLFYTQGVPIGGCPFLFFSFCTYFTSLIPSSSSFGHLKYTSETRVMFFCFVFSTISLFLLPQKRSAIF